MVMNNSKYLDVVTHSGIFHADEVTAVAFSSYFWLIFERGR